MRLANRMSGRQLYEWQVITADGQPAAASNGVVVEATAGLVALEKNTTILVVGGVNVRQAITRPILTWLRREARRGLPVGAVCTGAQVIAEAGLLDGRRCTIHWENRDGFEEEFPEIELTHNVFVVDRDRYTAAGGAASTDLMLKLIAMRHGTGLATLVADQMIHTSIRSDRDEQRLSIPARIGIRHPKLAAVIQRMEEHIEEPISPMLLARDAGMSTRQLERLFRRYLNRSPKRYYMELRLARARNLLMQTDMSVISVAMACGFASPSHFSKCYRALYRTTPYRERGASEETA
ncbi:transcriptional regulator GlxA family with amidase domain [Amaricoccus macauensis]|uniref:Transcriptional regulator GlxA family with amidase domain n=1 Tax=Amaricoccus macauensis TaxID=57001 RepID=A0A840SRH3_9RHOB|nr:transcriptional regulator GlxA family with amidase domain [Amaricoccus macauensis]